MKCVTIFILMVLVVLACENDDKLQENIAGEYLGIFQRKEFSSKVGLNFKNGKFVGESETAKLPAICEGNYSILDDTTIVFENTCIWGAEFDSTLILSDHWKFMLHDNTLKMKKNNGDKYILTKQ